MYIFSDEPKNPFSYGITFDTDGIRSCFEALLIFFTEGLKKKYGENNDNGIITVNLQKLTEENLYKMKEYMFSIGMDFILEVKDLPPPPKIKYSIVNPSNPNEKKIIEKTLDCVGLKSIENKKKITRKKKKKHFRNTVLIFIKTINYILLVLIIALKIYENNIIYLKPPHITDR